MQLPLDNRIPLAERMRPGSLDFFFGQSSLLAEGKVLRELLKTGLMPSMIFWGPPGTGKTTLAKIISNHTGAHFIFFSAVLSGIPEVRKIVHEAEQRKQHNPSSKTIFFVDEIHRFSKSQQDAFLPHVESGLFTLIGATTENPSFQVIAPLLSRCRVLVLHPLSTEDLSSILANAIEDNEKGLGAYNLSIQKEAADFLTNFADGDARKMLNTLEIAATLALQNADGESNTPITVRDIEESSQKKHLRYDKDGEQHYNLISALHKSMRDSDPDGSLYWYYRMIEAGEEPLYIARRIIRFASEDIGIADPHALVQALCAKDAYQTLGSPEGDLAIAQAVVYCATAPKSNAVYRASKEVLKAIRNTGTLPVPLHLRNAPTGLMKNLGYGKNYLYAHNDKNGVVAQTHLPPELKHATFYQATNRGYESIVGERLKKWKEILKKKK